MDQMPETRRSLLLRIRDPGDDEAWTEFLEIYQPLIYRFARRKGFQHADAEELTQEALIAVASAIERWDPDPRRGTFRGWLFRIARNMMINFLTRARPGEKATGGTDFHRLLQQQPAADGQSTVEFVREYRREVFCWAAREIHGEFQDVTWQAFWQTAVAGHPIAETARQLGMSVGAVYAARSRIMARLRRKAKQVEGQ
ncbi:MAG: sigma-70 family RNA polymerase sigma factor [Pirellulales bacterium]|nr:sigma-70 family RNA polymerase sigma factor [Pirellulales bacterium]